MKKQIITVLMTVFILSAFMACGTAETKNNESGAGNTNGIEKVRGIYGETEIPDVPHEGLEYEESMLKQCLDEMVFESCELGDYRISLVGDNVRTDKAGSPGIVYARNLRVEVEKNGVKFECAGYYNDTVLGGGQITEYMLFEDRIGSYITAYELDNIVIAMRYFDDNSAGGVTKMVEFVMLMDNEIYDGFVGLCQKGTGVVLNEAQDADAVFTLNDEDNERCRVSVFEAEEFKLTDKNTLVDEEAGIRYVFSFTNPPQMELYTVEKINN